MNKKKTSQKTTITYDQILQTLRETQLIVKETVEERKKTEQELKESLREHSEENEKAERELKESLRRLTEEGEKARIEINESFKRLAEEDEKTRIENRESLRKLTEEGEKARIELNESLKKLAEEDEKTRIELRESLKRLAEEDEKTRMELKEALRSLTAEGKRTERELRKSQEKLSDQMGKLGNRFGSLIEHIVLPGVIKRFRELGYQFNKEIHSMKIRDKNNVVLAEIDIVLENGAVISIVEVKAKPDAEDVKDFLKRIEVFCRSRNEDKLERKTIIGAIAGAIFQQNVRDYAVKNGLYVLTQSGDTMEMDVPENFEPRVFSFD
jgi:hypothetical protein